MTDYFVFVGRLSLYSFTMDKFWQNSFLVKADFSSWRFIQCFSKMKLKIFKKSFANLALLLNSWHIGHIAWGLFACSNVNISSVFFQFGDNAKIFILLIHCLWNHSFFAPFEMFLKTIHSFSGPPKFSCYRKNLRATIVLLYHFFETVQVLKLN